MAWWVTSNSALNATYTIYPICPYIYHIGASLVTQLHFLLNGQASNAQIGAFGVQCHGGTMSHNMAL